MNPNQAASIVRLVEYGWANGDFVPENAVVWLESIMDLPFEPTEQAIKTLIRSSKFRPAVADLRLEVARLVGALPPSIEEAFAQARGLMRAREQMSFQNGSGYQVTEPDVHPVVRAACDALGSTTDGWEKSFRFTYDDASAEATHAAVTRDFTTLALETGTR